MRKFLPLLALLAVIGCNKGPSITGTWTLSGVPQVTSAEATYAADGTFTQTVDVNNMKMVAKGTYTMAEDKMTEQVTTIDIPGQPEMSKMLQGNPAMKEKNVSTLKWDGNDKLTLTSMRAGKQVTLTCIRKK